MSDVIRVQNLTKSYGRHVAIDQLSFTVPRGSVFGLLGPNGAGKSTTFGILCGWLRPDSGHAEVLGMPVGRVHELVGRVAALPQDASFAPDLPIWRELAHFARLSGVEPRDAERAARAALDRVGLSEAAHKRGGELSHGMAKRAGLAQCLVGDPELVLLDEPTAGLDPRHARQVRDLIRTMGGDTTVVVSSHNLAEIEELCSDGAILDRGRLSVSGTIDALTSRGELVMVELDGDAQRFAAQLMSLEGVEHVEVDRISYLSVRGTRGVAPAVLVPAVLQALLAAGAPVVGVTRGRSLEAAFLHVTADEGSA